MCENKLYLLKLIAHNNFPLIPLKKGKFLNFKCVPFPPSNKTGGGVILNKLEHILRLFEKCTQAGVSGHKKS